MPDLTRYTDYRAFLNDYYLEKKKVQPDFTFMAFSLSSGMKSKGFLYNVIQGKRNLNDKHIAGLSKVFKFKAFERRYFAALVRFNQETAVWLKKKYYERLSTIKSQGRRPWTCQLLRKDQFEFYSKYHHSVVRSLIGIMGFKGDYKRLAGKVYPKITPGQARSSVRLLLRLGLIKKVQNAYRLADRTISTPPEIESVAVVDFHRQT
ncbi:MAG: TIGR02147 family protein, partial [Chitinispirillaceae bacterium]|nr:TIGR02147 family protein [Chitinispirillaceae bacterium]